GRAARWHREHTRRQAREDRGGASRDGGVLRQGAAGSARVQVHAAREAGGVVMLGEYLFNESSAMYCTSVLLVDHGVESRAEYAYAFERRGFTVVRWEDDLAFRIGWEDALKAGEKLAVIASDDAYVPYDLAQL